MQCPHDTPHRRTPQSRPTSPSSSKCKLLFVLFDVFTFTYLTFHLAQEGKDGRDHWSESRPTGHSVEGSVAVEHKSHKDPPTRSYLD